MDMEQEPNRLVYALTFIALALLIWLFLAAYKPGSYGGYHAPLSAPATVATLQPTPALVVPTPAPIEASNNDGDVTIVNVYAPTDVCIALFCQ